MGDSGDDKAIGIIDASTSHEYQGVNFFIFNNLAHFRFDKAYGLIIGLGDNVGFSVIDDFIADFDIRKGAKNTSAVANQQGFIMESGTTIRV